MALAGDICEVYAGTYAERVTPARSGTSGRPITFKAHPGDTVEVYSFNISNRAYITISGFEITNPASWGIGANTGAHHAIIEYNTIRSTGVIAFGWRRMAPQTM